MKIITLSTLFFFTLVFSSCLKEIPDLPRNNPNDFHSDNFIPKLKFNRWERTNSNNPIHSGEFVKLAIYLKNIGNGRATGVQANISSSSSYITPTTFGTKPFNEMNVGAEGQGFYVFNTDDYTIGFTVSSSAPIGTVVTFNIVNSAYNLSDSFSIIVQ